MAAPASAKLSSALSRHLGTKPSKPITTFCKPLDGGEKGVAVNNQHDINKREAQEGKRQAEER